MEMDTKPLTISLQKIVRNIILLSVIFCLRVTSEEQVQTVTTEGFKFPTYDTTVNVTESPDDNGMAIGDIPQEITSTTPSISPRSKEEEEDPSVVEEQSVLVTFPNNHKNFTPSQYLGDQDFPPYYNHLNSYQQQYKNYNEQKQAYSRKPVKFEENSLKNYYLPQNSNLLESGGERKPESVRVNRNPFPYTFDNHDNWYTGHEQKRPEKTTSPEGWYKNPEQHSYQVNEMNPEDWPNQLSLRDKPPKEHVLRGHQESFVPYYIFPRSHPHEDKFYKNEVLHFDQNHHVQNDEKENPWKKVFHVLTALVPLGLLLASLTPNVISINSTATTKATRQRSEDESPLRFKEEDILKLMKKYGVESLTEAECEDRIICELATEGGKNTAGPIEKGFWFLANQTPWDLAEKAGMNELFKAIKMGNCETYKCHARAKSNDGSIGKKLIRKHKSAK